MRYPYRSQSRIRLGRAMAFAALVFAVICLSGCGVVGNGINGLRAMQLPPGKLYDPEFYKKATPEDVRKAIGNRSLAEESYTERYYASNTEGRGFLAALEEKMNTVATAFIPLSSVETGRTIYPLPVAVAFSPHPEVISMMLDAGAPIGTVDVAYYVASGGANPEISKMLISRSVPRVHCESLITLSGSGNIAMMEYCLDVVKVSPMCLGETSYPMKAALRGGRIAAADRLLERGAVLPESDDERLELLAVALRKRNPETFNWLLSKGFDCSVTGSDGKNELMRAVYSGPFNDKEALRHLAGSVPVDDSNIGKALYYAYTMKDKEPLEILLKRVKRLPQGDEQILNLLGNVLAKHDPETFWRLVAKGADCSAVDDYGRNDLKEKAARYLPDDAKIAGHLTRHSPRRETGVKVLLPGK